MTKVQGYFMDNPNSVETATERESERLNAKFDTEDWIDSYRAYDELFKINQAHCTFLDVGCGTHVLGATIASRYPHIKVSGVDSNEKRIASANNTWKHLSNLSTLPGNACSLPMPPDTFDFVHSR